MILLLDNTVLSNFALVGRIDLLPEILGSQIATTSQVKEEYQAGATKNILPTISWDWLEIIKLNRAEKTLFEAYMKRVNAGEASCLAVAAERNGRIFPQHITMNYGRFPPNLFRFNRTLMTQIKTDKR